MVTKWRGRFAEDRLVDDQRPGRPRTLADEQVEEVIASSSVLQGDLSPGAATLRR